MFINCPFSQQFSWLISHVIDQSEYNIECSDADIKTVSVLSFEVKRQFDLFKDRKFRILIRIVIVEVRRVSG